MYDAVLLTSFGGPESPEEVMPFLERVTAGRGVPRERLEEVSHHYLALGGVSPINEQNRQLLAALRAEFAERGMTLPIYWGNRNSEPYFVDVVKQMHEDGHKKVLALVTSAYSSYSGCRQYRENLAKAITDAGLDGLITIDKVRHYFDHPGFIGPVAEDLALKLDGLSESGIAASEIAIMFATHSIPSAMGESSGPEGRREAMALLAAAAPSQYGELEYVAAGNKLPWLDTRTAAGTYGAQHLAAASAVMEAVGSKHLGELPHWSLVYQSRSGAPTMPWLEPDVNDAIKVAAAAGAKAIVVVPIGFVSDHVEVIWDLDNEAKATAEELGMAFERVNTPGIDPLFVQGVCDLVAERLTAEHGSGPDRKALSSLGPWQDFCTTNCCPNLRHNLAAIAQQ